jgi:ATP-binding cassette subfamily F protein uup
LEREKELNKYYNLQIEIKDLEIDKSKIDFLFSDEKVADADSSESEQAKQIIGKANELQTIIQKMEEKDERWFELCAKMESLAP